MLLHLSFFFSLVRNLGKKKYFGKGLGRESLITLKNYCFQQLGLHRLQAGVSEENLASLKVFQSTGYQIEGLLRDSGIIDGEFCNAYILGILSSDHLER